MTSVPRWEQDGTESPAERTDPLLPAITDDMPPPLGLPRLPTLDDRSLAQMLAELEGEDADGSYRGGDSPVAASAGTDPMSASGIDASSSTPSSTSSTADSPLSGPGSSTDPADDPRIGYRPAREHARAVAGSGRNQGRNQGNSQSKYVRRDLHPHEVSADALTLTGLTRRSRSRVGSILFKAVFVGIFLLILLQAIVSLLTPGT